MSRPLLHWVEAGRTLEHLPGLHDQSHHAGWLDAEELLESYGEVYDEAKLADLSVVVFTRGDFGIYRDGEGGTRKAFLEGLDYDSAITLADALDWAITAELPDDAENSTDLNLYDWRPIGDDVRVGYDTAGDISVIVDNDRIDLGSDDAYALEQALQSMADRFEELDEDTVERFDPNQRRDRHGKWSADGLGLAARITLDVGEALQGAGRIDPGSDPDGDIAWAVTSSPRGKQARISTQPRHAVDEWNGDDDTTTRLNRRQVRHLHDDLADGAKQAKKTAATADREWSGGRQPGELLTKPVTTGSAGDLRWEIWLTDDDPTDYLATIGVGDDPQADGVRLDPKALRKLLATLSGLDAALASDRQTEALLRWLESDQLKNYWTKGEGLAKWANHTHAWTALFRQLRKHMSTERAKRVAAQWFHDVKGYWPGHQRGENPVGPG